VSGAPIPSDAIGTILCPSCGGAVKKTATACPYCGAVVELPKPKGTTSPAERKTFCTRCGELYPSESARCPRCPPSSSDEPGRCCPRCAGGLETQRMGDATIDRCRSCHGLWFDGDELEHALDVTTRGVSRDEANAMRLTIPPSPFPVEEIHYLACVRCGERMARRQIARRAGVIIDVCCLHGVWFDAGEFEHFVAFVRAGGLEIARQDGIAAAEARERAVQAAPAPTDVWTAELRPMWRGSDPLGLDILRAIRGLFRRT
jgi:Zn-finger nucleic acid-binding protein